MCDTLADHLFTPQNAAFLLIDYQPAQLAAVRSMDHAGGLTVVAVDRNEHALRELPDGVRREVADTTDPSVATPLIDRIAGEGGPPDVAPMILTAMKDQERSARSLELGTARVEAFSDAVMAVIITIMAFQLRAPRGATLDAVREQLPGLLVYVLSFVFVGIYWNNHHHLLRAADRLSGAAMWRTCSCCFGCRSSRC
ncbi:MAG TPA: TMEM175 family protein [Propionibacteriaceae bacterium]|nr:TMEM175 family protein [Propionibacteriaceae bacterium]